MAPNLLHLAVFLFIISSSYSYHVLVVFTAPSHSHNQLGKGVVDALLDNGHTVTWVTPYPEKAGKTIPKNLNLIAVSEVKKLVEGKDMTDPTTVARGINFVKEFATNISKITLGNKEVRDALINQQFDAVVTEAFFNDAMAGLAAVQQVPWILLAPMPMMPNFEQQVDEVRSISTVPLMFNEAGVPMNFLERAKNGIIYTFMAFGQWMERPIYNALYQELFAPIAKARNVLLPNFEDAYHNVSILLVNSHETVGPVHTSPPNVVNIAGYHIDDNPPPLPQDLQELMDKSKQGVVYFSLGSVVRSAALKPHTRKALLAIFAKLPYTVLWKFEEAIDGLPPNVHVRPWMPQASILVHPNIKLFITHGGQLSSLEAVNAGVPLLAIPVFGDQPANAHRAVKAGYALKVPFHEDMAEEFGVKLNTMLSNSEYNERAKFLSKIFRGRPLPPKKLLAYYIELAISTKGAYHLRSLSLRYSWIERWMLDVVLVIITALITLLALITLIIRTCYRKIFGKKVQVQKKGGSKKRN